MLSFFNLIRSLDSRDSSIPDAATQPQPESRRQRRQRERNAAKPDRGVKTEAVSQDLKSKTAS